MPNVAITFDDAEQMQLEEILMDREADAAFEFLERIVKRKLDQHLRSGCKPEFEGPATMPFKS